MTPLDLKWEQIFLTFGEVYTISLIIPIIVAIFHRKHWNPPLRIIFYYCVFTLLFNLLEHAVIWVSIHHYNWIKPLLEWLDTYNTHFLSILYYLKDFLLLGWFFSLIFPIKSVGQKIKWLGWLLALLAAINHIFIEGYKDFGTFNPRADAIFILGLPVLYLWFSQRQSIRISLRKNPYLWISLGLIIPNVLALFLYLTGDYLYNSNITLYFKLFTVKNIFEIIGQVLIAIGFLYARYTRFISGSLKPTTFGS